MVHSLTVTQARKQLPSLLKSLQRDPNLSITICVRNEPIAVLSPASKKNKKGKAVKSLLALMKEKQKPFLPGDVTSENYKAFFYDNPDL